MVVSRIAPQFDHHRRRSAARQKREQVILEAHSLNHDLRRRGYFWSKPDAAQSSNFRLCFQNEIRFVFVKNGGQRRKVALVKSSEGLFAVGKSMLVANVDDVASRQFSTHRILAKDLNIGGHEIIEELILRV